MRPLSVQVLQDSDWLFDIVEDLAEMADDVSLSLQTLGIPTPCRTTGVTFHSHVRYEEIQARACTGLHPQTD